MTQAYPLQWPLGWPRTANARKQDARNRWGKKSNNTRRSWTFSEARDELFNELQRFGASNIVLSTNFQLTQAGIPSRNFGIPEDQGVAIYFTVKGKSMVMAQDGYTRAEENLRSLALVLKYLRGVEELGGGTMMEKTFDGFMAIPAPKEARTWREVFGFGPGRVSREQVDAAYRQASKKAHPDAPGGSHDAMSDLNRAREEALREIGS
jgi:hypothetical protein